MPSYILTTIREHDRLRFVDSQLLMTWDEAEAAFDLVVGFPNVVAAKVMTKGRVVMNYERL